MFYKKTNVNFNHDGKSNSEILGLTDRQYFKPLFVLDSLLKNKITKVSHGCELAYNMCKVDDRFLLSVCSLLCAFAFKDLKNMDTGAFEKFYKELD